MNASQFEVDELTGLWKWPVLLNGDWSQWTDEPCAVLFGETRGWDCDKIALSRVGEILRSSDWPDLAAFRLGQGSFLILAPGYSSEQALLLAQNINRELAQISLISPAGVLKALPTSATLTWGLAIAEDHEWNFPLALQAAIKPLERAMREKRFGSINEAPKTWGAEGHVDFWICSRRDPLTELKLWSCTVALCCRYRDEPVALLKGDVDQYKQFNEMYGHGMGDVLLQMLAHVLRRFESNDVAVFRLGGDEFLVWTRGNSLERAKQLAEQINTQMRVLQIPIPNSDTVFNNVSLTWGVVAASPHEMELQTMLNKADDLLDQAKCEQRGSVNAQRL